MIIDIRQAFVQDAELIADLSRETFYAAYASQNTKGDMDKFMNEQFSKEALMKEVEDASNVFFIACINNEAVGYVRMREGEIRREFIGKSSIEIARIYAISKMIGKGVGSALMQKCIDIAKEKNKQVIWVGVWKENKPAIDFYTKWGFKIFAEHSFLLGNDLQMDWLMKKDIT